MGRRAASRWRTLAHALCPPRAQAPECGTLPGPAHRRSARRRRLGGPVTPLAVARVVGLALRLQHPRRDLDGPCADEAAGDVGPVEGDLLGGCAVPGSVEHARQLEIRPCRADNTVYSECGTLNYAFQVCAIFRSPAFTGELKPPRPSCCVN